MGSFEPEVLPNKCQRVSSRFDQLGDWGSSSVPGAGFDPNESWPRPALAALQARRELVGMARHDPIIVVTGCDQGGWVTRRRLEPMQRRILHQIRELGCVLGASKFADPSPTDREAMEAEHIHHANGREGDGE